MTSVGRHIEYLGGVALIIKPWPAPANTTPAWEVLANLTILLSSYPKVESLASGQGSKVKQK